MYSTKRPAPPRVTDDATEIRSMRVMLCVLVACQVFQTLAIGMGALVVGPALEEGQWNHLPLLLLLLARTSMMHHFLQCSHLPFSTLAGTTGTSLLMYFPFADLGRRASRFG